MLNEISQAERLYSSKSAGFSQRFASQNLIPASEWNPRDAVQNSIGAPIPCSRVPRVVLPQTRSNPADGGAIEVLMRNFLRDRNAVEPPR